MISCERYISLKDTISKFFDLLFVDTLINQLLSAVALFRSIILINSWFWLINRHLFDGKWLAFTNLAFLQSIKETLWQTEYLFRGRYSFKKVFPTKVHLVLSDGYFHPICSRDRELSTTPSKALPVEAKLMHIYHFFNLCWKHEGGRQCRSTPSTSSPPLTLPLLSFVLPPLINKQVACGSPLRRGLKSHFDYRVTYAIEAEDPLSRGGSGFSVAPLARITGCCFGGRSPRKRLECLTWS